MGGGGGEVEASAGSNYTDVDREGKEGLPEAAVAGGRGGSGGFSLRTLFISRPRFVDGLLLGKDRLTDAARHLH